MDLWILMFTHKDKSVEAILQYLKPVWDPGSGVRIGA